MKMHHRRRFLVELQDSLRIASTLGIGACAVFASVGAQAQEPVRVSLAGHMATTEDCTRTAMLLPATQMHLENLVVIKQARELAIHSAQAQTPIAYYSRV